MVIALGDIYAQIQRRDEVRELMRATQERMREEPGCAYYAFAETLDDPGHFVVVQEWSDQAALDDHYRSRAFAARNTGSIVRSGDAAAPNGTMISAIPLRRLRARRRARPGLGPRRCEWWCSWSVPPARSSCPWEWPRPLSSRAANAKPLAN